MFWQDVPFSLKVLQGDLAGRGHFLKLDRCGVLIWYVRHPGSSLYLAASAVKSYVQSRMLSMDLFQEGGLQHPAHTSTMLLSLLQPTFGVQQNPKKLKKMVKGD